MGPFFRPAHDHQGRRKLKALPYREEQGLGVVHAGLPPLRAPPEGAGFGRCLAQEGCFMQNHQARVRQVPGARACRTRDDWGWRMLAQVGRLGTIGGGACMLACPQTQ